MSYFFGKKNKVKPEYTGLQAQTSSSTLCVPLAWGKNRFAPNIIWYGDFQAHKQKQKTGKGGGKQEFYTYSASLELGLCEGPINDIARVWKDQSKYTSYADPALGFSLFTGTYPQAPWGYLTSNHPDQALGYPGTAYLAVANYDLGQTNTLGQHSFEVEALQYNTGVGGTVEDADPALIIEDFLVSTRYSVGFDSSMIDQDWLFSGPNATTTGDSAFQTYCRAMGFALSPVLADPEQAGGILERWVKLCNSEVVYTGYSLLFVPRGDEELTANGVTYLPPTASAYTLGDGDYVLQGNEDPIKMNRKDPADAFNTFTLNIKNRANEYNNAPVEYRDQALIDTFGLRPASPMGAEEVCDLNMATVMVQLIAQREAYVRNEFRFKLGVEYCRLLPMTVLTAWDPRWGFFPVRILQIDEDDEDNLSIIAEEFTGTTGSSSGFTPQPSTNTPTNTAEPPGPVNPPLIFDVTAAMSEGVPQVWAAVSGGDGTTADPNWGGAYVWVSTDGTTYQQIGTVDNPARMGVSTTVLAPYGSANPQTATVGVNLAMSDGELIAATAAEAEANTTLSVIMDAAGGNAEFLSFEDATLTVGHTYTIGNDLWRNLFGTTGLSHAIGSGFARLDQNIFKYNLPNGYIGQLLYFKFQSFNIYGGGLEDLASCVAYTYTPTGLGYSTLPPDNPYVTSPPDPPTGLSVAAGTSANTLTWTAPVAGTAPSSYKIFAIHSDTGAFGSSTLIASVVGTSFVHGGLPSHDTWRYWVVASNLAGDSTPEGPQNQTTTATPYGFAFNKGISSIIVSTSLVDFDSPLAWTLPSGLTNAQGTIVADGSTPAVAPSADTDFDIQVNGVSVGTMRFATSSLIATFVLAADAPCLLGQITRLVAPANLNGMTGRITASILGYR